MNARAPSRLVRTVQWCVRCDARVYVCTRSTRYEVKAVVEEDEEKKVVVAVVAAAAVVVVMVVMVVV